MATEHPSAGEPFKIYWEGAWHELIVRTRASATFERDTSDILSMLTIKTISTWLHVWKAIKRETWLIDMPSAEQAVSEEFKLSIHSESEPFVTVFNKSWDGLSITVHSSENGTGALNTALALFNARGFISEKMPALFSPDTQAPAIVPKPANSGQKDLNNVDDFIPPYQGSTPATETPQTTSGEKLPFRFFKRIAPNVIQLQEFKKGGGETYTKSAIEATLPYHKDNPQYDENSLVYYPITGVIQIKEGKFGKQAIIPTSKGRIYVDAEYNGQEKPEWATLSADLYDQYERLTHDENEQLNAPDCVLVLKSSALTFSAKKNANAQYKNFYHIYQPLKG